MLHSKIWDCEEFISLKPRSRLLYIGMITLADDEGRLRGDGRFLKKYVFSRDRIGELEIEKMRDHVALVGLIDVYESQGRTFIAHPHWDKYQTLDKRRCKPSDFPAPPACKLQTLASQVPAQVNVIESNEEEVKEGRSNVRERMLEGLSPDLRKSFEIPQRQSIAD